MSAELIEDLFWIFGLPVVMTIVWLLLHPPKPKPRRPGDPYLPGEENAIENRRQREEFYRNYYRQKNIRRMNEWIGQQQIRQYLPGEENAIALKYKKKTS